MPRFLFNIILILGLLVAPPTLALTSLSDHDLSQVSGGGIDSSLGGDSLPKEQQQPTGNTSALTASDPVPKLDGMDLAPEFYTVLQSSIAAQRARRVLLSGSMQESARAMNLENVASSDSIASNNLFDGYAPILNSAVAELEVNQGNDLQQLHRRQGELTSSSAEYYYELQQENRSGSEFYEYRNYSLINRQLLSETTTLETLFSHAQVGGQVSSLDEIVAATLPLVLLPQPVSKPLFGFDPFTIFVETTVGYSGITLHGLGLRLTGIEAGGSGGRDLILNSEWLLPWLDFGTLKLEFADAEIASFSLDPITAFTLSNPQLVLPGMAPQIEELNLGSGFAVSGSGVLNSSSLGGISIDGEASLRVTPYATLRLDLTKLEVFGLNVGQYLGTYESTLSFDLVDKTIPFVLVNEEFGDLSLTAGDLEFLTIETEQLLTDELLVEQDLIDVAESSYSESSNYQLVTGGQMQGGQAALLALSDGTLVYDNDSQVALTDGAQRQMRVLNGVNASASIAANSLNVGAMPALNGSISQLTLRQQNSFVQQR